MQGRILQVNISPGGVPKRSIPAGVVGALGIDGDGHAHPEFHGGPRQALLLISIENIELLKQKGYPLFPGALGENVTTEGLDYAGLRLGNRLRLGSARIELTEVREPCRTIQVYGRGIGRHMYERNITPESPRWGVSGFYAAVLQPGEIRPHDVIALEV